MSNHARKVVPPRYIITLLLLLGLLMAGGSLAYAEDAAPVKTWRGRKVLSEKTYYYLNDHLGDVDVVVDDKGTVVERNDYKPYGQDRAEVKTADAPKTTQGFTGKEKDEETGLYYYGARYYDPAIGRFVSSDPVFFPEKSENDPKIREILQDPQNLNAYSYARNNPLKFVDPDGEFLLPVIADPTTLSGFAMGQPYAPQNLSNLEKSTLILFGSLATGIPAMNAGQKIAQTIVGTYRITEKFISDSRVLKKMNPNDLTPTEQYDPEHLQKVQRQMKNAGQFRDNRPVKIFENEGENFIVDGHHRTQAAKNLGYDVWTKKVDSQYFQRVFKASVSDFIKKAKDFVRKTSASNLKKK